MTRLFCARPAAATTIDSSSTSIWAVNPGYLFQILNVPIVAVKLHNPKSGSHQPYPNIVDPEPFLKKIKQFLRPHILTLHLALVLQHLRCEHQMRDREDAERMEFPGVSNREVIRSNEEIRNQSHPCDEDDGDDPGPYTVHNLSEPAL